MQSSRLVNSWLIAIVTVAENRGDQMALSPLMQQLIEKKLNNYCDNRIPVEHQNKIKIFYRIRGNMVTIIESRPLYFHPDQWSEKKIAQMRYDDATREWTLYFADRNERWHMYMNLNPSENIDDLLNQIDADPTGIFYL